MVQFSKDEFFKLLDRIDLSKGGYYWYDSTCNDPHSHEKFQPKSAKYGFYLVSSEGETLLHEGSFYRRSHEENEEALARRFTKWARDWRKVRRINELSDCTDSHAGGQG
ncbi:hypothetical protein [Roseivirga pacifica]|uniref:hypothetical protein n=1 Tax=Roseivirga pacifica TaxID=1267423 RepID=UPI002095B5EC|nr:hypothetical protein [Roseivirga pacifica]MCO6358558.1 hypothetical protein [Roseivirga pacifica]MCO6369113.1 hypothetical protein [Roseivirga pacifica]MCO6372183.1 hypothetical protein [Roseivirga pacifica]MCO6380914.1 hypothetical protein [Roseivirga pacifica]